MSMKKKPSMDEFLNGGAAVEPAANPVDTVQSAVPRRQKMAILPVPLLNALKQKALDETVKTGARVTETDIIERALNEYIYK